MLRRLVKPDVCTRRWSVLSNSEPTEKTARDLVHGCQDVLLDILLLIKRTDSKPQLLAVSAHRSRREARDWAVQRGKMFGNVCVVHHVVDNHAIHVVGGHILTEERERMKLEVISRPPSTQRAEGETTDG